MMEQLSYALEVNGVLRQVDAPPSASLLGVLRGPLGLTGTKFNCEQGECGACTVLIDDRPVNSCLILAASAAGHAVTTIEGVSAGGTNAIQDAFMDSDAAQCGYCTPGMVMSATALLQRNPEPRRVDIEEAVAGNYCRCTGYESIVNAVQGAAGDDGER